MKSQLCWRNRSCNQKQVLKIRRCKWWCSEHPDCRKLWRSLRCRSSTRLTRSPRSMRRQVPMIQDKTQKDQEPEEVQISFSPYFTSRTDKVQTTTRESRWTVVNGSRESDARRAWCTSEKERNIRNIQQNSVYPRRIQQKPRLGREAGREARQGGPAGRLSRKAPTKLSQNSQPWVAPTCKRVTTTREGK